MTKFENLSEEIVDYSVLSNSNENPKLELLYFLRPKIPSPPSYCISEAPLTQKNLILFSHILANE